MAVTIDPTVLDAVAASATALADDLPSMLIEAQNLHAGWAVRGLTDLPSWAEDTTVDLRARVGILATMNQQAISGFGASWLEIAAGRKPVAVTMSQLGALRTQPDVNAQWQRRPNETLDDWVTRLQGLAIDKLTHIDGAGQPIAEAYGWFNDYVSVLYAGGMSGLAVTNIAKVSITRSVIVPFMESHGMKPEWIEKALTRFGTYRAPGTTAQSLLMKVLPLERFQSLPPSVVRWAETNGARTLLPAIEARLPGLSANVYQGIFGQARYTYRALDAAGEPIVVARGASNLVSIARDAEAGTMLRTVGSAAGFLRGAGVVGSAASVGWDVAELVSQGNPVEAFKRDGAGYVADIAKTGLDISLTAALIAPSPITWGAVAVTGAVYAGAELVDHWDDVTAATEKAADWAAEQAGAVADHVGDAIDAVADSKVNPMNWF